MIDILLAFGAMTETYVPVFLLARSSVDLIPS